VGMGPAGSAVKRIVMPGARFQAAAVEQVGNGARPCNGENSGRRRTCGDSMLKALFRNERSELNFLLFPLVHKFQRPRNNASLQF
jgi:hypothetical protein